MSLAPRSATRVAIIDDHVLFAESLAVTLEMEGYAACRVSLTEAGGSTSRLLSAVRRLRPHIALLDLDLGPGGDGLRLVEPLARAGVIVVAVTATEERFLWGECLRRGARAVMRKTVALNEVVAAVRRAHEGLPLMTREERQQLIDDAGEDFVELRRIRSRLELLTPREEQVLGELMQGRQVADIARRSVVSEATVRTQVKSILAKLDATSQIGAVGAAHRASWRAP